MADFGKDPLKISAYTFAGLAMMLNIRLVYSAAPYALLRFKLPENLFSVFVRIMAGSLELWCLPSMTIANIMDFARKAYVKQWKDWHYHWQSIFWSWANFFTFVVLWISFIIGGDQGNVTAFYWVIAASGFVFGINMVMVYAMEFQYLSWYMVGENSFPMVTSLMHYVGTLMFGNRRKWNSDYIIVTIDIVISLAISLVAAVLWTLVYHEHKPDGWGASDSNQRICQALKVETKTDSGTVNELTYSFGPTDSHAKGKCGFKTFNDDYYAHFVPPGLMVLVGMGLVYAIYPGIAPGMIVPFYLIDKIEMVLLIATAFPPVIIAILKQHDINPYINMGNWGYHHAKQCKGNNTTSDNCPEGTTTTYTTAKLKVTATDSDNKLTKATLELTPKSGGPTTELTYPFPTDKQPNGTNVKTVKFKLKDTIITITPSGGGNKATGTLTTNASISTNLDTLKGTGVTLSLTSGQLTTPTLKDKKNNPITSDNSNTTLNNDENIKLEGTIGGGSNTTTIVAEGKITITNNGQPTKTLQLSTDANVQLTGGLTGNGVTLSLTNGQLTGVTLAPVQYIEGEFHVKHKTENCCFYGKVWKWESNPLYQWNLFTILVPLKISLAAIFIYSLHYRNSSLSRSIINQPKMSTALSIVFYMCHEILLAMGFPGISSDDYVLLPVQLVGAFLMVLLAYYSVGYITEYKRHDPLNWPTEGMTKWNALCYWLKMASKITNKNFKQLFTTDLRRLTFYYK